MTQDSQTTQPLGMNSFPLKEGNMILQLPSGLSDESEEYARQMFEIAIRIAKRPHPLDVEFEITRCISTGNVERISAIHEERHAKA